jgi:hypothetical protein
MPATVGFSRRKFLTQTGMAMVGTVLSACGPTSQATATLNPPSCTPPACPGECSSFTTPIPPAATPTPTHVAYYISPHPDDWQIFRADQAYKDMWAKVVFIYISAGDGGRKDGWWQCRELGAIMSAVRVLPSPLPRIDVGVVAFNGHPITSYMCGNTKSYFLRIPDGNRCGDGFPAFGNQSLKKLRENTILSIEAVDGSTTYHSWEDFCATLEAIIVSEKQNCQAYPWINAPEFDRALNPCDHEDHYATADALNTSYIQKNHFRALWVGYDSYTRCPNQAAEIGVLKWDAWRAYGQATLVSAKLAGVSGDIDEQTTFPYSPDWVVTRSYWRQIEPTN